MDDRQLLRQFAEHNSQEAFAALTTRYLNLVYSVCRRELDEDTLAEDVTQAVFLILARKAPSLRREVVLSGWLFQTARFAAKNARTQEQRRKAHEQKAAGAMPPQEGEEDPAWAEIEPLLNQSLAALREGERECVLLRFFQQMSFAEVGTALGLSEEAARKRVTRALDKMRQFMTKNGVVMPSVALAVLMTAHAAKSAPATCQAGIAHLTTGALTGSPIYQLAEGVLHTMKIVQIKIAIGFVAMALVGAVATYGVVRSAHPSAKKHTVAPLAQATPITQATPNTARDHLAVAYSIQGVMSAKNYKRLADIQTNIFRTGKISDADLAWVIGLLNSKPLVESEKNDDALHRAVFLYLSGLRSLPASQKNMLFVTVVPYTSAKNPITRGMSATLLGEIGDSRALLYLREMQNDQDANVSEHATQAIGRLRK